MQQEKKKFQPLFLHVRVFFLVGGNLSGFTPPWVWLENRGAESWEGALVKPPCTSILPSMVSWG